MEALTFLPSSKFAFASRKQIPKWYKFKVFHLLQIRGVHAFERGIVNWGWPGQREQNNCLLFCHGLSQPFSLQCHPTTQAISWRKKNHASTPGSCVFFSPGSWGKWQTLNGRDKMWWQREVWLRSEKENVMDSLSKSHVSTCPMGVNTKAEYWGCTQSSQRQKWKYYKILC